MYLPLMLVNLRLYRRDEGPAQIMQGLHLRKLQDGTFRRIGLCLTDRYHGDIEWLLAPVAATKPQIVILS